MRIGIFVWLMLAGLIPSLAGAQTPDSGLERFTAELVNAYKHPAPESIRPLMHPKSVACLKAEPKYERYLLRAETMQALPADAKISVEAVTAAAPLPYRGFTFPQRPTHVVHMEFGKKVSSDGRSSTTQISDKYLARSNDRWFLIMPCPTPEGLGRLRDMGLLD